MIRMMMEEIEFWRGFNVFKQEWIWGMKKREEEGERNEEARFQEDAGGEESIS